MRQVWTFEDINWNLFDKTKVEPEILKLIKMGSVVEYNGSDYGKYLKNVFHGDTSFQEAAHDWALDEIKHGKVLAKWIKLADPDFDFDARFQDFTMGYRNPIELTESVRGSRAGELLARCMVEIGTSTLYTAIKESTSEPLLQHICSRVAADELRHYKLFYTHLRRYQKIEKLGLLKKLVISINRFLENEDDELAYAYFAANQESGDYNRDNMTRIYGKTVYGLYKKYHTERAISLLCKAIGLNPYGIFHRALVFVAWRFLRWKTRCYQASV